MRCQKFDCKRNWSWLDFNLAKLGGLTFFASVAKLMNNWSHGFLAILVGIVRNASKMRCQKFGCKRTILVGFWLSQVRWIGFFLHWLQNWWVSEVMVLEQSWWGIVTNAFKMRCQKFGCERNSSWFGFGLAKLDGLAFFALVATCVKRWSHGFWALVVGNCHKCMQNEVWKVWLPMKLILVGFWLSQIWSLGLAFVSW